MARSPKTPKSDKTARKKQAGAGFWNRLRGVLPQGSKKPKTATTKKPAAKSKATNQKAPAKKARGRSGSILWRLTRWCLVALIWISVFGAALLAWFAYDLPDPVKEAHVTRRPSITLLAADGSEISSYGDLHADVLRLKDVPQSLIDALLATEDRRFYSHFGIDVIGITRAGLTNLKAGRVVQGGSTITQQVAKNLFLTPERTFRRKVQEVLLSLWLERLFTKDQILTLYINRVYLGGGTYGADAAARRYFGRSARHISIYQSAILAGLPKAPSRYNPHANPDRAHARAREVIGKMVDAGKLTPQQAKTALSTAGSAIAPTLRGSSSGYFADWVLEQVDEYSFVRDRDLIVRTTLLPDVQRAAENAVATVMNKEARTVNASQAALTALDQRGAVRAMIGGRDHARAPFNRASQARRQAGSAFKPFVFLSGLEAGLTPESILDDAPVAVGTWRPGNYNGRYLGPVTMKAAFAKSINTVSVRISESSGRTRVARVAERFGLSLDGHIQPSIALGAVDVTLLELSAAYVPFANGGLGVTPYGIDSITTRQGQVLYKRRASPAPRVATPSQIRDMNLMLAEVVANGTGKGASLPGRTAFGKTGTSQQYRDAWFVGFTGSRVTGVWVGNDDASPMKDVTGGTLPTRIWRQFMVTAPAW